MAHARRKFDEALDNDKDRAGHVLTEMQKLYAIEKMGRDKSLSKEDLLFAGSHNGARRAAMLYSFLGTCKINNVNPFEWLRDILRRIPSHSVNKLQELLPNNWAAGKF